MKTATLQNELLAHDWDYIRIAVFDIDGVPRGKWITKDKLRQAFDKGLGFCNVVFGWDLHDTCYSNINDIGYPDEEVSLDVHTLRWIPWMQSAPMVIGDFENQEVGLANICPRTLLKKIIRQAEEVGFRAEVGFEYEWFNFEKPRSNPDQSLHPISQGMFGYSIIRLSERHDYVQDLLKLLRRFDIPIEGIHTETGDGVYEACIEHAPALIAADRAALFKLGVREIAHRHYITPSFMAKWNQQLPGCGGHVHQSLWNQEGLNVFASTDDSQVLSPIAESYLAGQLLAMRELMPMYAPTINSYKRYVKGSWAAISPNWGIDNRTTALRFLPGSKQSARLETRVPGADANPYLVLAAALASGLYGIANDLKLTDLAIQGNAYEQPSTSELPKSLEEAVAIMKQSELARTLLGSRFVDAFVATREWECQQFRQTVTDYELKRYWEII